MNRKDSVKDAITIDYESLAARDRPRGPPPPVGVAVRIPGEKPDYLAFGHPTGNTHTHEQAQRLLGRVYEVAERGDATILTHNNKFEVDVGEQHLDLPRLPWDRYHDTQPMLFIKNPHAPSYKLKESAERELGEPPTERDEVVNWLVEHQPVPGVRIGDKPKGKNYAGAYVAYAPVPLVKKYAIGDVNRAYRLAQPLHKWLKEHDALDGYNRERRLLPVQLEMENRGMRVDVKRLKRDEERYSDQLQAVDTWIGKRTRSPGVNVDSPDELGGALVKAGLATLNKTKTGKYEVNKDALAEGITDKQILHVLKYRGKLATALRTFIRPWLEVARYTDGVVFTNWMSTRQEGGGARTGRFSSSPNFQNLPKEFEPLFFHEVEYLQVSGEEKRHLRKALPKAPIQLLPLPNIRTYVLPWDEDHVLIDRDYSQQEPRILAHYSGGELLRAYLLNPWIDFHDQARDELERVLHKVFKRKPVKNINLGLMYGMGLGLLAEKAGTTVNEAKEIKNGILTLYPGWKELFTEMKQRAAANEPIRTWGGRPYWCEPPKFIDGRLRTYDYKLVNVLIQGSAADCTKEALIAYHNFKSSSTRLYLSAHDELLASVPRREWRDQMELMRRCMESVQFNVAMLSEGAVSHKSWGDLQDHDKKGKLVFVNFGKPNRRLEDAPALAA
jgi:DNA polymerase I